MKNKQKCARSNSIRYQTFSKLYRHNLNCGFLIRPDLNSPSTVFNANNRRVRCKRWTSSDKINKLKNS
ncbi:hypothetical protein M8J75_014103 [Diaphorina citri]|nr:hypothetical protein M8J75_014103 [Diaphorina citri]